MSEIARLTGVPIDTIFLMKIGKRYQELANEVNFKPIKPITRFNFSPYENKVKKMVLAEYTNKEIRTALPLPISEFKYNYYIRKIRELVKKGSTTS